MDCVWFMMLFSPQSSVMIPLEFDIHLIAGMKITIDLCVWALTRVGNIVKISYFLQFEGMKHYVRSCSTCSSESLQCDERSGFFRHDIRWETKGSAGQIPKNKQRFYHLGIWIQDQRRWDVMGWRLYGDLVGTGHGYQDFEPWPVPGDNY